MRPYAYSRYLEVVVAIVMLNPVLGRCDVNMPRLADQGRCHVHVGWHTVIEGGYLAVRRFGRNASVQVVGANLHVRSAAGTSSPCKSLHSCVPGRLLMARVSPNQKERWEGLAESLRPFEVGCMPVVSSVNER